jgi:DNA-binding CsgD family transcriptional regulator
MDRLAPGWRTGAVGRIWGQAMQGTLLGAGYVLEPREGRMLGAYIAVAGDPAGPLRVLQTTLPLLGVRTVAALGPTGGDSRNWVTPREQEILDQLATGRSVRQIAEVLGRSPHTVHDHVKTLHRKLRATTRGQLIARALGHGVPPGCGGSAGVLGHA